MPVDDGLETNQNPQRQEINMGLPEKKSWAFYNKLFFATFTLSAFTFGGGYVMVSFMKKRFVDAYGWIEEKDMMDMVAIAQSAPGAIAVNASIMIGYRMAGIGGAILSIVATVLPPLLFISVLSFFYLSFKESRLVVILLKSMSLAVAAILLDVVWNMAKAVFREKGAFSKCILVGSFIAIFFLRLDVRVILLTGALLGGLRFFFFKTSEGEARE
jgi:chromate transporter